MQFLYPYKFTNLIHWMILHTPLDIVEHHHHDHDHHECSCHHHHHHHDNERLSFLDNIFKVTTDAKLNIILGLIGVIIFIAGVVLKISASSLLVLTWQP